MILYPAIDILDGQAVRLTKGDFGASKVYDEQPLSAAKRWVGEGAARLHMVDLDGARAGRPVNIEHVRSVVRELGVPVQLGGGLRTAEAISLALGAGVERVILGTAAFTDPDLLERALAEHGPRRVAVSVDVRDGRVATEGWTETVAGGPAEVIAQLQERGVRELVYTAVDRDGMLEGPDLEEVRGIAGVARAAGARLVYSGGIGSLADLAGLAALGEPGLAGVIVGKALYEERFTVAQARAALGEQDAA